MTHPTEHILERFVLADAEIVSDTQAIEAHLNECAYCRGIVIELRETYSAADKALREQPKEATTSNALVRAGSSAPALFNESRMIKPVEMYIANPLRRFIYRRPIAASTISFSSMMAIALTVWFAIKPKATTDTNPTYYRLDQVSSTAEFKNKSGEPLWKLELFSDDIQVIDKNRLSRSLGKRLLVFDLDNDGTNEVFTTLGSPKDQVPISRLRIFDNAGRERRIIRMDSTLVHFRDLQYSSPYFPAWVEPVQGDSKSLLAFWGGGRSPTVLTRYSDHYKEMGAWWHFGDVSEVYLRDITGDGNDELILNGANDVNDRVEPRKFVLVVLDPQKINGTTESSATRGFGHERSNAELYYVSLPIANLLGSIGNLETRLVSTRSEETIRVQVGAPSGEFTYSFEYIFSKDLRLADVKWSTGIPEMMKKLKQGGKIQTEFNQAFLNGLKNKVEWWDGERWSRNWTKVKNR